MVGVTESCANLDTFSSVLAVPEHCIRLTSCSEGQLCTFNIRLILTECSTLFMFLVCGRNHTVAIISCTCVAIAERYMDASKLSSSFHHGGVIDANNRVEVLRALYPYTIRFNSNSDQTQRENSVRRIPV